VRLVNLSSKRQKPVSFYYYVFKTEAIKVIYTRIALQVALNRTFFKKKLLYKAFKKIKDHDSMQDNNNVQNVCERSEFKCRELK
jgi:hypothetical protein